MTAIARAKRPLIMPHPAPSCLCLLGLERAHANANISQTHKTLRPAALELQNCTIISSMWGSLLRPMHKAACCVAFFSNFARLQALPRLD